MGDHFENGDDPMKRAYDLANPGNDTETREARVLTRAMSSFESMDMEAVRQAYHDRAEAATAKAPLPPHKGDQTGMHFAPNAGRHSSAVAS
jgi:hypothetical protein